METSLQLRLVSASDWSAKWNVNGNLICAVPQHLHYKIIELQEVNDEDTVMYGYLPQPPEAYLKGTPYMDFQTVLVVTRKNWIVVDI